MTAEGPLCHTTEQDRPAEYPSGKAAVGREPPVKEGAVQQHGILEICHRI